VTDNVAGDPQQVIADLQRRLDESIAQQTATADVLKVISRSTFDLQTVLETLIKSAAELCRANRGSIFLREGDVFPLKAASSTTPEFLQYWAANPARAGRGSATSRVIASGKIEVIPDILEDPDMKMSPASLNKIRAALGVPMLRNDKVEGVLVLTRPEPGPFTKSQIDLVQTFADQAMIAIENARLFNEVQAKTADLSESLQQQTATADVLKVISRSVFDLQTVLDTLVDAAYKLCDAKVGLLYLRGEEAFECKAIAGAGVTEASHLFKGRPIRAGRGTAAERVILTGEVQSINNFSEDPEMDPKIRDTIRNANGSDSSISQVRSTLAVPMTRDNAVIGVMVIGCSQTGPFPQRQIELLQTFADQAVIAIENARLFDEVQTKTADLQESLQHQTATSEVLKVISRSPGELDPVFQTILASATSICGAQFGNLFVLHEDGGLRCDSMFNLPPAFAEAFSRNPVIYPPPIDPLGRVIATRQLVHVVDVTQEPAYLTGFPPIVELVELGGARTVLLVPMLKEDTLVGVIAIFRQNVHAFSGKQIDLVKSFASQAVIAIENARLLGELRERTDDLSESLQQQTATADVLQVISTSVADTAPVFDKILEGCGRLFNGTDMIVFQVEDNEILRIGAIRGPDPDRTERIRGVFPLPITGTAAELAIRERRLVTFGDVLNDPGVPDALRQIAAWVGVNHSVAIAPMLWEDRAIGTILVSRTEPMRAFDAAEQRLLQTFADQAVIAIENARLFNETKEALERQTATAGILKVIASSPSDAQPVFEAIVRSANTLIGGFSSTVFRFIDGVGYLKAFTPTTPAADEVLRASFPLPVSNFAPFQMAEAGEATQVADTETLTNEILGIARARGFRSILFAPMMNDGVSIGAIAVTRVQPGTFADHHVQLLQTFADQAVIAIENVRLFEQVQARTEDLRESLQQQTATAEVLKVISRSTFDLQAVLDTLIESAAQLCEANAAHVYLREDETYKLAACSGFSQEYKNFLKQRAILPGRDTLVGRTVQEGRIVSIPDILLDTEYGYHSAQQLGGFRTMLGVPMLRDGAPIGVLGMTRSEARPFTEKQIDLLTTFADQAVIAIENVRLFEQVQERTQELSLSLDELRTAQDRLVQTEKLASLGQLTAGIAHEIKNPLNFVNNFSALSGELVDELNDLLGSAALDGKTRAEIDELTHMLKGNLEKVVQHGKRADSIVKNMLLHSREGSGERRPADINTIVEESLNLAYHGARAEKAGFNITLQRDLDPSAGVVDLYPQEITRVFLNLISNGFYAANKRKEAGDEGFEPLLSATTKNLGSNVEIRIRDNGAGIPAEVKAKMFNPFFTTKPAGEGTGLGLSMSHDIIVKQHGGKIDVETEPGAFTEFIITLPRATAQAGGRN
jgi:two-component system, NtrC family, sensor kinase